MVSEKDKTYLNDILREIANIEDFVAETNLDEFFENIQLQYAVAKALENIGEASHRISDKFKKNHTKVSWAKMYGLRNRITHEYRDIDYKIVWDIIKDELPKLEKAILKVI